ncbi:3'-5' exonuclease [Actibacterium pelagium]|uniref:DNA-directed DNA polymerase n=1 Tax=Actibacterium pelagium TaxID=2029103 RepID=A0A917ALG6_9RHOB|nr:exonuclease domain-containing protein [Actibacterium pelagium]GGE60523.1 DNA polymerase III subunit epsilon [Actibacterium pelagium]
MKITEKLSLRIRVFLFFAFLGLASVGAVIAGLIFAFQRAAQPELADAFTMAGLIASFGILGLTAWVWFLFDENVAKAIQKLAGGMMARAHAEVGREIDQNPARYLGELAPAAKAVTQNLSITRSALAEAVERETEQIAREKTRLAGLLADVPEGVLLCSGAHNVVFYNGSAVELLAEEDIEPGLNRSLFTCLRPGPIRSAYARLRAGEAGASTELICATIGEGRVLSAQMRLMRMDEGEVPGPGYVLTLRDITAELAQHAEREEMIETMVDRTRRPVANMQTLLGAFDAGDAPPEFRAALEAEVAGLARDIDRLGSKHDAERAAWWPKGEHRAADIVDGVISQLDYHGINLTADSEQLLLTCDAYQVIALLSHISEYLVRRHGASALSLLVSEDEHGGAMVSLGWAGETLPFGMLDDWLEAPMDVGLAHMTGRSILHGHATDMWPEPGMAGRAVLRLPIQKACRLEDRASTAKSRAAYDFDLLSREVNDDYVNVPLRQLSFVVFDTETTGLLPHQGDEIVQIAGVRLVNGRRVEGEEFDSLVNPGRSIPPGSTEVHGITEAMVADADPIQTVGRRFHRFAEGAVLVAHNAPFDMAFFKRHEGNIGKLFDHPVLDTVLLSAVLFGQSETHTLDALTERLGIIIPPELRHTAMGDTVATAKAFEMMLPMLQAKGLNTFGDVLVEVRKHARLIQDLNADQAAANGSTG